jgi:hypothetical protein
MEDIISVYVPVPTTSTSQSFTAPFELSILHSTAKRRLVREKAIIRYLKVQK